MLPMNYRGIRPANLVTVLEGNGTPERPYQNVTYVLAYQDVEGLERLVTLGKLVPLTEEERGNFRR